MKRLRVMQFLCCLSLMLCVTCSEVFSIKAFAYNSPSYLFYPCIETTYYSADTDIVNFIDDKSQMTYNSADLSFIYEFKSTTAATYQNMFFGSINENFVYPFMPEFYDYYCIGSFSLNYPSGKNPFSVPYTVQACTLYNIEADQDVDLYNITQKIVTRDFIRTTNGNSEIYDFSFKLDEYSQLSVFSFSFYPYLDIDTRSGMKVTFERAVLAVPKDSSDEQVASIIAAIQNQTTEINDKIDEVLTPEGEHNLDAAIGNVNDKINENMGALGFAHDTVVQFADLFTETPGDPVITVPPLKMSIKGQEYEFFHGYQYDFRSMETGALAVLVTAVRTVGTIVLWLAFLYYCSKEFNGFFRR